MSVSLPLSDDAAPASSTRKWEAVWDTGATGSVISQAVVNELGLQPVSFTQVHTANGTAMQPAFMVALVLSDGAVRVNTRVTMAPLVGCDVLIGMDVINLGDFSVTNYNGKTTVSFRIPSCEEIDYVQQLRDEQGQSAPPKPEPSRQERRHPGQTRPKRRRH